jgi:tetratricopeptide (TPR) repeat protein
MDFCQKAGDLLTNSQTDSLHAKFLHLRGIINRDKGDLENAATDLEEALRRYRISHDQTHTANITGDLGIVYYLQNQFEEAVSYYRQAVAASEANQDLRGAMIGYFNIGDVYLLGGKYDAACTELRTALEIARKKKITWMQVNAGLYLAEARIAQAEFGQAHEILNSLKPLLKKQASRCFSGLELTLHARLYWKWNQIDRAKLHYKQAFELLENATECQYECARAYVPYAEFLAESRRKDLAELALQKGRKIFEEQNNQLGLELIDKSLSIIRSAGVNQ